MCFHSILFVSGWNFLPVHVFVELCETWSNDGCCRQHLCFTFQTHRTIKCSILGNHPLPLILAKLIIRKQKKAQKRTFLPEVCYFLVFLLARPKAGFKPSIVPFRVNREWQMKLMAIKSNFFSLPYLAF